MLIQHPPEVTESLQRHSQELAAAARQGWGTYGEAIDRLLGPGNELSRTILKNVARLEQARQSGTYDQEYNLTFPRPGETLHPLQTVLRRMLTTVNPGPTSEVPPPSDSSLAR